MNEQTAPTYSKSGKTLVAYGVAVMLFVFGFLPFGLLGFAFLGWYYDEVFIKKLFWVVFLAIIAYAIILIRLAIRYWDEKRKAAGTHSVLFWKPCDSICRFCSILSFQGDSF